jgi:hypothetical protein
MYDGVDTSQSTFSENFGAGRRRPIYLSNTSSKARSLQDAWQPFIDEINTKSDTKFENPALKLRRGVFGTYLAPSDTRREYNGAVTNIIDFLQSNEETFGPDMAKLNHDYIINNAIQIAKHESEQHEEVAERSGSWVNGAARFFGEVVGTFDDPVQQDVIAATAGLGALVNGTRTIGGIMLREAMIGAGTEIFIQKEVADWYKELDLPYTIQDFAVNVGAAGALSAAFPLSFKVGGDAIKLTVGQAKKGYNAIKTASARLGQRVSNDAQAAESLLDTIESTIGTPPIRNADEHFQRVDAAEESINNGQAPNMPDEPISAPTNAQINNQANPGQLGSDLDKINLDIAAVSKAKDEFSEEFESTERGIMNELMKEGEKRELTNDDFATAYEIIDNLESKKNLNDATDLLQSLNKQKKDLEVQLEAQPKVKPRATINDIYARYEIEELNVDAQSYQFKEGSDEFGVTEQLRGEVQWNQEQSGVVLVHERADGKLFIADGHQRLALAKRIKEKDPNQDIFLLGITLREKDGISVENAMVRAAVKNIGEGTGTVLDAVKILRGDPQKFKTLPPRSALVKQARSIVKINDNEAYGLFVNGLVSPQQTALVGRMIPEDATMQRAAMNVLAKAKPENDLQAESIIRQVMDSGTEKVNQESLFGNALEEESLYFERAKILDNAVKVLQRDKSAFNTIVKNQTKFESEGNQLARSANEQKIQKDGQAIQLIQTLANRRGQLSDDLTAAARIAKQSDGQYNKATESFVDSVRGAVDRGDFNGEILHDPGLTIDAPPQNGEIPTRSVEKSLEDFDNPAGLGSQKQMNQMETDMFPPLREGLEPEVAETKLKLAQPIETVDNIYELAPASQEWLAGTGKRLEAELGVKFDDPGLKKRKTANEKMIRKKYKTAQQMTDIARGGFIVKSLDQANKVSEEFSKVADVLDTGWQVYPEGYSDRKLLVRTPNGIIAEIQMWTPEVKAAKFGKGTELYTKARSSKDPAEISRLSEEQKVLYRDALKKDIQASEGKLAGIDSGPKVLSNIDLNEASSATRLAEWKTSRASTSSQDPPGLTTATASRGSSDSSAGLKSQLQNETDDLAISSSPTKSIGEGAQNVNTEAELDIEIPVGQSVDAATGEVTVVNQTMRQIKEEIDYENSMIERMGFCLK